MEDTRTGPGLKMKGKSCLITGATSGIGEATARALAGMGSDLFLLCRNLEKGERLAAKLRREFGASSSVIECDLSSLDQVRKAANVFRDLNRPLDVLLNNAGVFNFRRCLTCDGHEEMFAVNHLSHFLLTRLLLPCLLDSHQARIVTVGSGAHRLVRQINFADLNFEKRFRPLKVYSHSKLANGLFTVELARQLEGTGVTANVVDPGEVSTNLGGQNGWISRILQSLMRPVLATPEDGARTSIFACSSSELTGVSGAYLRNSRIQAAAPWASDMDTAKRLWQRSLELVSV